jgi:hypothetical protein
MSDLVRGRYPVTSPAAKLVGLTANATQGNIAIRSNAEWPALGNWTDGALAATGVGAAVAVPVEVGDTFTKVSLLVGAAAEATGTHAFVALYSGIAVPALLAQSTDLTGATAVGPVNARFDFTLASAVTVTQAIAPGGFIYASIVVTATTVPTVATASIPTAIGYQWYTAAPLFLAATHGSGLTTTAPGTIASPAAKAVAPIVFLW